MAHDLRWLLEVIASAPIEEGRQERPDPVAANITEGRRNESLASLAGTMRRRGMDQEAIEAALLAHNRRHCEPPLDDEEVVAVARSIARYEPQEIGGFDEVLRWADPPLRPQPDELAAGEACVDQYLATEPPEVEMLVQGLLPARVVGMVAGAGGVGKTSLLCEMAVAMAGGRCVFGHWAPTKPLKVAMLIKEDDDDDLWRMLYRAGAAPIVTPRDAFAADRGNVGDRRAFLAQVSENLRARSLIGRSTVIIEQDGKRAVVSRWYGELLAYLERLRDDMGGLDVVILDPLRRFSNCDENDSNAANMLVEAFDRLRDHLGCTVLTTHHLHKGGDVSKAYASRGSSALEDGGRFVLNVGPIVDDKEAALLGLNLEDGWNRYLRLVNVKNTKVRRAAQLVVERTDEQTFEVVGTYAELMVGQRVGVGKARSHYDRLLPVILELVREMPGQYTPRSLSIEQGGLEGPLEAGRDTVREICISAVDRGDLAVVERTNEMNRVTKYLTPPGWTGWPEENAK